MIHPTAIISQHATLGNNIKIGPFTIIHPGVVIGDNTTIDSYCELGYPTQLAHNAELIIGADSLIRSHSVFYIGSKFAAGLKTGHRVTVRENTNSGVDLQLGTLCDIQGDCQFGMHVRLHSNVHICKKASIGNFCWIFPYVVLTNDSRPPSDNLQPIVLEDFAIIASSSIILPGLIVGKHAFVGAHSCVTKDVPASTLVRGNPAKIVGATSVIPDAENPAQSAYPWPRRFQRGYPAEIIDQWAQEFGTES